MHDTIMGDAPDGQDVAAPPVNKANARYAYTRSLPQPTSERDSLSSRLSAMLRCAEHKIRPRYENTVPSLLTPTEREILITSHASDNARKSSDADAEADPCQDQRLLLASARQQGGQETWHFGKRQFAQPVLEYLWLGPNSAIRDHDFLRREGITKVLVFRNADIFKAPLRRVEEAVLEVGVEGQYLDVTPNKQLTCALLAQTCNVINSHVLRVHHTGWRLRAGPEQGPADGDDEESDRFIYLSKGKVLVTCETGNNNSALVVAAYLMAVFGIDALEALTLVNLCRLCTDMSDATVHTLATFEGILRAQATAARAVRDTQLGEAPRKRGIEDISFGEGEAVPVTDLERFTSREAIVPFEDGVGGE